MNIGPPLTDVVVGPSATIRAVMQAIDQNGRRGAIVCDADRELLGIAMDSDIRRALLRNVDLGASVKTIMRTAVFVIDASTPIAERHRLLIRSGKLLVPIVDERRRVVDCLGIEDVLQQVVVAPDRPAPGGVFPPAKVLVIGGAGYIGSMLVEALLGTGYHVRALDMLLYGKDAAACFEQFQLGGRFEFVRGDCRDEETVRRAMDGADAVVHLGEIVGDPACQINESFTIDINYAATHMIVECCMKLGIQRFVFASSCSVYGHNDDEVTEESAPNPVSLYARCKVESEKAIVSFSANHLCPTILRFATAHGRSHRQRLDLVVNYLTIKALAEGRIQIMGGQQWRPFAAIRDICRGVLRVLQAEEPAVKGQIFNLGDSSENYQIIGIGHVIKEIVPEVKVEVLAGETDMRNYRVSFSKINRTLGFSGQYTVGDTVRELVHAYRDEALFRDYLDPRYHNMLALR
jgi:nucleoside-diphosphate-sugar epimerase